MFFTAAVKSRVPICAARFLSLDSMSFFLWPDLPGQSFLHWCITFSFLGNKLCWFFGLPYFRVLFFLVFNMVVLEHENFFDAFLTPPFSSNGPAIANLVFFFSFFSPWSLIVRTCFALASPQWPLPSLLFLLSSSRGFDGAGLTLKILPGRLRWIPKEVSFFSRKTARDAIGSGDAFFFFFPLIAFFLRWVSSSFFFGHAFFLCWLSLKQRTSLFGFRMFSFFIYPKLFSSRRGFFFYRFFFSLFL